MTPIVLQSDHAPWCRAEAAIRQCNTFPGVAQIFINVGACTLYTYATATELRALAHAATLAADELDLAKVAA